MYKNLKILILGAAKSGLAVAKLIAKDNDVTITDLKELKDDDKKFLEDLGVKIIITDNQTDLIDDSYDLIIKNPAIKYVSDVYQKCLTLGLRIENELEVAYHFLPKDVFIIGITGSNGKTTITTMVYELLKKMNKSVICAGNIGDPLASVVDKIKSGDILVLELSDHQLIDMHKFKTNISVVINIVPTHLDYHGCYENYRDAKKNIFNNHTNQEIAILNKENSDVCLISNDILSKKVYFNDDINYVGKDGIYIDNNMVLSFDNIKIEGKHNYENILASLLVIKEFGLDNNIISDYYKQFGGVEHRLEFVVEKDHVKYYNDSKATNPMATITALKTFKEPLHLILGGQERYQDFTELDDYLSFVKQIYAVGTVTDRVYEYALIKKIPCIKCYTLKKAMEEIKNNVKPNEVVLLSTASASQDQYRTFEERGKEFKSLI